MATRLRPSKDNPQGLVFTDNQPQLYGFLPGDEPVDADIAICYAASVAIGKPSAYRCPDRQPLYAVNGRPC